MSYTSISSIITALADDSIKKASAVAAGPHGLAYDNINVSSSIFVEQAPNSMSKVQSGTFGVIYELLNAREEDMQIKPMVERLKNSAPLQLSALRPSTESMGAYATQTAINISSILLKYVDGFETLKGDLLFQHLVRRKIPDGHKTRYHPVRASTIEEASIPGNLQVHNDIYCDQLGISPDNLNKRAIPCINDQLTNARNRGAQEVRKQDVSYWERREIFQLGFGIFHLVMNLIWALLETYRGTINQTGSLSHLFAVLEKTRLGGEKPDYHTLLASLTQIAEGLILNAWRNECGFSSLQGYAKSSPKAQDILNLARKIMLKYATPKFTKEFQGMDPAYPLQDLDPPVATSTTEMNVDRDEDSDSDMEDDLGQDLPSDTSTANSEDEGVKDTVHQNTILLTRDLLYIIELNDAISTGDFGRIEDILPALACLFRGAGSKNYSLEILYFLFHIKEVWTPEFA